MSTTSIPIDLPGELTIESFDSWLMAQFVCPVEHAPLRREGNWFVNTENPQRRYPIVNNVPVFLRDDIEPTAWWATESLQQAIRIANGEAKAPYENWDEDVVHPHVQAIIDSTGGYLYRSSQNNLSDYPIPSIRVEKRSESQVMLDVGCNWGRWTYAASRAGIPSVGVDPSLDAVMAARGIRRQLKLACTFFVGDSRWLPFRPGTFTDVFSYSVIQHFSKENAGIAIAEANRVLCDGGSCLIQMPNRFGVRSLYHLARRGFRSGQKFDVRYYTAPELRRLFKSVFGNATVTVDGFFGLGIQPDDISIMPLRNRIVIRSSEVLRKAAKVFPPLINVADSLYVKSTHADNL